MIEEVRRQFREITGLIDGKAEPDSARCVEISTRSAIREMVVPGLIAVLAPIAAGFLLGVSGLGGLLAGALVTGVLMALMMAERRRRLGQRPRSTSRKGTTAARAPTRTRPRSSATRWATPSRTRRGRASTS